VNKRKLTSDEYVELPYSRIIIPDMQSGTFTAEIAEFPGCIAQGDTAEEAYEKLQEAAKSWIEASQELGQEIPLPLTEHEFSGKFALRLPRSLHRQAALAAEREGTSLNQFIIYAVSEKVGALCLYTEIAKRVIDKVEFHQRKFQTAFNHAFQQIEYAIQKQANTSPSQFTIGQVIGFELEEGRVH